MKFTAYTCKGVKLASGTADLMVIPGTCGMHGTYGGMFDVTYGGATHHYSWELTMDLAGGTYSYAGVFTVDYNNVYDFEG